MPSPIDQSPSRPRLGLYICAEPRPHPNASITRLIAGCFWFLLHLDDAAIETMVRALIEAYLADDARAAALDWLEKRTVTYQAVQSLRLLDGEA
jgi:hypothetical protein